MFWKSGRRSGNVEDRRGRGVRMAVGGAGGLLLVLLALALGINPGDLLDRGTGVVDEPGAPRSEAENELADFVSVVLADTEDTWRGLFAQMGKSYREPKLVLFTGSVESACGLAGAAVGPFFARRTRASTSTSSSTGS